MNADEEFFSDLAGRKSPSDPLEDFELTVGKRFHGIEYGDLAADGGLNQSIGKLFPNKPIAAKRSLDRIEQGFSVSCLLT